jgi:hypothetical protein
LLAVGQHRFQRLERRDQPDVAANKTPDDGCCRASSALIFPFDMLVAVRFFMVQCDLYSPMLEILLFHFHLIPASRSFQIL